MKRRPWKVTEQRVTVVCFRCNGAGRLPRFSHYYGGLCFECKGAGQRVLTGRQITYYDLNHPVLDSQALVPVGAAS